MATVTARVAVEAIRDFGVEFIPYEPDGRPWASHTTAGGWAPVGVTHHHTGPLGAVLQPGSDGQRSMHRLLRVGRPDLSGPLCHLAPTYMGKGRRVVYGIGWGNTNHAGLIAANVAVLLRAGKYKGERPGRDAVDGNAMLYGLEYLHPGDDTPWPEELLDAGHRTAAALCEAHGWTPDSWPGSNAEHRELTSRKIDRSWIGAGDGMRSRVRRIQEEHAAPVWNLTPTMVKGLDLLERAAAAKQSHGMKRQAAAIRAEIRQIKGTFPGGGS